MTTQQNTNNELTERVAVEIWDATGHLRSDWIYMAPEVPRRRKYMMLAEAAITAAAPILQAQAWDEGYDSGHAVGYGVAEFEQENPYTTP